MAVKYSKTFTTTNPLNHETVTVLVEYIEAEGFRGISVESLEGEYDTAAELNRARDSKGNPGKIHNFLPLTLPDAQRLTDALTGALQAADQPRTA